MKLLYQNQQLKSKLRPYFYIHNLEGKSDNLVVDLTNSFNVDTSSSDAGPIAISLNPNRMIIRHKLKKTLELKKQMALIAQSDLSTFEPKSFRLAMKVPCWLAAIEEEMQPLHNNQTWTLVPRQKNVNVIGSK